MHQHRSSAIKYDKYLCPCTSVSWSTSSDSDSVGKTPKKNTDAQKYGEILIEYGDSK